MFVFKRAPILPAGVEVVRNGKPTQENATGADESIIVQARAGRESTRPSLGSTEQQKLSDAPTMWR